MINTGYFRWKSKLVEREAVAAAAAAQTDADTGIADAATAQGTADDAAQDIVSIEATLGSVTTQTEQLFNAALSQVATPYVTVIPYSAGLQIAWTCTTPGHTLYKRLNGGSWTAYTGVITLTVGDTSEAYATATGLTDSEIAIWET